MQDAPRLIFDIGFNNGDDTAHYLTRGFEVLAVEANPELVEAGRKRFADAIANPASCASRLVERVGARGAGK